MINIFSNEQNTKEFIEKYQKKSLNNYDKESIVLSTINIDSNLINYNIENNVFNFLMSDLFLAKTFLIQNNNYGFSSLNQKLIDNIDVFNKEYIMELINHIKIPNCFLLNFFEKYIFDKNDINFFHSKKIDNFILLTTQDKIKIEKVIGTHLSFMYIKTNYEKEEKNMINNFLKERYSLFTNQQLKSIIKRNLPFYDAFDLAYIKMTYRDIFEPITIFIEKDKLLEIERIILNENLKDF